LSPTHTLLEKLPVGLCWIYHE